MVRFHSVETPATHPSVTLREVIEEDIAHFFDHQLDPAANHMAVFTVRDPSNREAFIERWKRILSDPKIRKRTILCGPAIVGQVLSFELLGQPSVSYWIDPAYWNRGIATTALGLFLSEFPERPLYARAAKENIASLRVLEKCGFTVCGEEKGFSPYRGIDVEELILSNKSV